jgi:hypothetical protein
MNTNKYDSIRALQQLDDARTAADWAGDTALLPKLEPKASDDTVPMLPALMRPQAE